TRHPDVVRPRRARPARLRLVASSKHLTAPARSRQRPACRVPSTCPQPASEPPTATAPRLPKRLRTLAVPHSRRYPPGMSPVTQILSAIEQGDPHAADQLLPLVYDELRQLAAQKLAHEQPGQTLDATALVHEAYLRLVDVEQDQQWNSRGHFFAAAAEAMRR